MASVPFDTTKYGNTYLVFWVVVWMEDASGNLIREMTDHGLTANPATLTFQQITDVPVETYSNNAGMYPVNSPFFVFPANTDLRSSAPGSLMPLKVSADRSILLNHRTKVMLDLHAQDGDVRSVNVAYFDGDPHKNGRLLDAQKIAYMAADSTYQHGTFFQPRSCGPHTLYGMAWTPGAPEVVGSANTIVNIEPVEAVTALINSTKAAELSEGLRRKLLLVLEAALSDFERNNTESGVSEIHRYLRMLRDAAHKEVPNRDDANVLLGQGRQIVDCLVQVHRPSPALDGIGTEVVRRALDQ